MSHSILLLQRKDKRVKSPDDVHVDVVTGELVTPVTVCPVSQPATALPRYVQLVDVKCALAGSDGSFEHFIGRELGTLLLHFPFDWQTRLCVPCRVNPTGHEYTAR